MFKVFFINNCPKPIIPPMIAFNAFSYNPLVFLYYNTKLQLFKNDIWGIVSLIIDHKWNLLQNSAQSSKTEFSKSYKISYYIHNFWSKFSGIETLSKSI